MGKKKVDVLFKVELSFDEKAKITKSSLKNFLEEKIKGLKVVTYDNFTQVKDQTKAEVVSNVIALLHAEELVKEGARGVLTAADEGDEGKESGSLADKLLAKIKVILGSYNDKAKKKAVMENLDKLLEPVENKAMELCAHFDKLLTENVQLKSCLDSLQRAQASSVSKSLSAAQMDQTASLLKSLENENARLQKKTAEYEEKLVLYEKNVGDKVLLDRITELQTQLRASETINEEKLKEKDEEKTMLSLELIEKTERIKELEALVGGTDKGELLNAKKELEAYREKYKELEEKLEKAEKEGGEAKAKLELKEDMNKQLMADLARSLDGSAQLEEKLKGLTKELTEAKCQAQVQTVTIPSSALLQKELEPKKRSEPEFPPEQSMQQVGTSDELEKCTRRLSEVEAELKTKNNKLSHLTALLALKEEEVVKFADDFKQVQDYFLKAEKELKMTQQQFEKTLQEKLDLQRHWESADTHATNVSLEGSQLKEKVAKLEELIAKKEEEKTRLLKMIEERNDMIRANEDRYIEYETNKEEMAAIIAALQDKLRGGGSSNAGADLVLKMEEYKRSIKELQESNKQKAEQVQRLEEDLKRAQVLPVGVSATAVAGTQDASTTRLREYERLLIVLQTEKAALVKTTEELGLKVKELQLNNDNLKKLVEITNSDSTKLFTEIESKDATVEQLTADISKKTQEYEARLAETKVKLGMDVEVAKRELAEMATSLEKVKAEHRACEAKCKELQTALEEKTGELRRLETEKKKQVLSVEEGNVKKDEELNNLKLKVLELETQLIDKASPTVSGADKSVASLQLEVKQLRKQQLEQRQLLISEQLKVQKELEKHQSSAQSLSHQLYEKELALLKRETELRELQATTHAREARIGELEISIQRKAKDYEELKGKLVEISVGKFEGQKAAAGDEVAEYLNEIVYLYKTLTASSKERIEEKKNKLARVQLLSKIMAEMSDKKITKEKLRTIVTNSLPHFPYLAKFDLKSDYKFIVMSILKMIEHKLEKIPVYEADCERNSIVLNYAEPKLRVYSEKASALLTKKKK